MTQYLTVPDDCTGITTVTSGAQIPTASNTILVTTQEFTDIIQDTSSPRVVTSNVATGAVSVSMSQQITSISMNGNTYAVTAGISVPMSAYDATQLIYEGFNFGNSM